MAAYVRGLVVAGQHRGAGLGRFLLEWAGAQARKHGRALLRLDCGDDNEVLRRYYAAQGFQAVGRRDAGKAWSAVGLLEQQL